MARNPQRRPQAQAGPQLQHPTNARMFDSQNGGGGATAGGMAGPGAGIIKMLQKALDGDTDELERAAEEASEVGIVPPEPSLVQGILQEMQQNVERAGGASGGQEVSRQRPKEGGAGPLFKEIGEALTGNEAGGSARRKRRRKKSGAKGVRR